jgi:hypothetical protein
LRCAQADPDTHVNKKQGKFIIIKINNDTKIINCNK